MNKKETASALASNPAMLVWFVVNLCRFALISTGVALNRREKFRRNKLNKV